MSDVSDVWRHGPSPSPLDRKNKVINVLITADVDEWHGNTDLLY